MYFGQSGSQGILLGKKEKENTIAVYGYYEQGEIVIVEDEYEKLKELRKEREETFKRESKLEYFLIVLVPLILIGLSNLSLIVAGFREFIAMVLFSVISCYPILVLSFANINSYIDEDARNQMRRFHGCEHATIRLFREKEENQTYERLQELSIYHAECGTMYAGYFLFFAIVLALIIINPLHLGLFKAVGILFGTVILLFVNIFNPYNPFKIFQKSAIAKPTDYEYELGWELFSRLKELMENA